MNADKRFNALLDRFNFHRLELTAVNMGWSSYPRWAAEWRGLAESMLFELHEANDDLVMITRSGLRAEKVLVGDQLKYRLEFVLESATEE